jgi:hypothetical protein
MVFSQPCRADFGQQGGFGNAFVSASNRALPGSAPIRHHRQKRKGLQLALEPLDGRGIAGYVPKP